MKRSTARHQRETKVTHIREKANGRKVGTFDTSAESKEDQKRWGKDKTLTRHDLVPLTPLTEPQEDFLHAYASNTPLIIQQGSAGTGKTYYTLSKALEDIVNPNIPQSKIIIIRSAVSSRDVGFLKGTLEEKQAVYENVYRSAFSKLTKFNDPYDNLKAIGCVEFRLSSFVRGETFDDAIIIVDEFQNTDREEIFGILTRMGETSRMILCGDGRQDDLKRKKQRSAFSYLERLAEKLGQEKCAVINYRPEHCLRHGLVRDIMLADEEIAD